MVFDLMKKEWVQFGLAALTGLVGAFGQAALLWNNLDHSYPYKMMSMPPANFYSWIGNWGYYVSISAAIVGVVLFSRSRPFIVAAIPVALCPIAYWLSFELAFLFSPYHGELMSVVSFDSTTGETARYEFGFAVLSLLIWGTGIGLTAGFIIEKFMMPLKSSRLS